MEISNIPLVYNGDIFCLDDYKKLKSTLPECNSWMIGRGLVSNPFLPSEIKTGIVLSESEKTDAICDLHNALYDKYSETLFGPAHILGKMKEYWLYMSENIPNGSKLLTNIRQARTPEHYEDIVSIFFDS
jgi:tRNA-dihydrouridine synthase